MEEKQITEQESLLLIQQMIHTAKKEQTSDGKSWIVWGWLLFTASLMTLLNLQFHWVNPYFFWNLFGLATALIFLYELVTAVFVKKRVRVKTYTRNLFKRLNIGFFISLLFIIIAMNIGIMPTIGFALLINLYAFWILIYGTALDFKPSIIAAYITWTIGVGALFAKTFELVMALHGLAALIGYIIPGHIANKEFKKVQRKEFIGV